MAANKAAASTVSIVRHLAKVLESDHGLPWLPRTKRRKGGKTPKMYGVAVLSISLLDIRFFETKIDSLTKQPVEGGTGFKKSSVLSSLCTSMGREQFFDKKS